MYKISSSMFTSSFAKVNLSFVLAILLYVYSCVTDSVSIFLIANSLDHQFHVLLKPFVIVCADMSQPDFCLFCIMFSYKVFFYIVVISPLVR